MKNAIKYGLLIGVLSAIWIFVMHSSGVFNQDDNGGQGISWAEYLSVIIPFLGLYFGVKNYRDHLNNGRIEFFEAILEGFKILIVGGVLTAAFMSIYINYIAGSASLKLDYMQRIFGAGVVGILLNLVVCLMLMNKQKNL